MLTMEENVALDSTKQRKFNKSIKGIKKLLKKNEDKPHKPAVLAPKDAETKKDKKKRPDRGLVYLSHIPHGFYEHEMTQYFKQFGMVTKVRVIRSPRTGRSKGYAFVEFREPAVAEIVAETMNNYLMGKRLIKAAIIPPEKQKHKAFRKYWSAKNNPTANRRLKERKAHNADKTDAEHLQKAKRMLLNLQKTKKKLMDQGINYDFFKPVDIPEALLDDVEVKAVSEGKAAKIQNGTNIKQNKKKEKNAKQTTEKQTKEKKEESKPIPQGKGKKEAKKPQESDKGKQNEKQKKMQAAGVKLPENFVKIAQEEDSDSSLDFDSDEYEKMLANDSDASSGDESDDDNDEESDDEESDEDLPELVPIKEKKTKKPLVALPPQKKASKSAKGPKAQNPPQPNKGPKRANVAQQKAQVPQSVKRKNLEAEVSPKKPKFEKKDKKPRNKQFKKKNKA